MSEVDLIPSLPCDIALDCLLRATVPCHSVLEQVCRSWKSLIRDPAFLASRRRAGYSHHCACLIQALHPNPSPCKTPSYGITVYDSQSQTWERLPALPDFPDGLPLFCQCVSVAGSRLVVLGGWDPATWKALRSVYVYEFARARWRRGADMGEVRSFFACGAVADGSQVVVAGGHDDAKNALRTAEVYDVEADKWSALPEMSQARDECRGVVVAGGRFLVVSGYPTHAQGHFCTSAEAFDFETQEWSVLDNLWAGEHKSPSSLVFAGGCFYAVVDGKLVRRRMGADGVLPPPWEVMDSLPDDIKLAASASVLTDDTLLLSGCGGAARPYQSFLFTLSPSSSCSSSSPSPPQPSSSSSLSSSYWRRLPSRDNFLGPIQASCPVEI